MIQKDIKRLQKVLSGEQYSREDFCLKINKSKGYGGYHMLNSLNNVVNFLNSYIWGVGMLILIVGSGLYFTIRLHGFQFVHFKNMWSRIIDKQDSDSGISAFGSFCTTMAMRVGTGNVAGVAVAIYMGGPGALFWMILAVVVIGGVKRISAIGVIIQQGVKRGTFSSASGMGEASPTAAAAETSHPVKQGMANAAGVWLDMVIICNASGLMILLTDCFNTANGYVGSGSAELPALAAAGTNGVIFVQLACKTVMGKIAPTFIAIMLALFSFTCLISYYYEAEAAAMYLFQGDSKAKIRKVVTWIMRIAMPVLIFIWGNLESDIAWNLSDLALGSCTWVNMLVVLLLSPKVIALYKDYESQMKEKKDPYYNPDKLTWDGVDTENRNVERH